MPCVSSKHSEKAHHVTQRLLLAAFHEHVNSYWFIKISKPMFTICFEWLPQSGHELLINNLTYKLFTTLNYCWRFGPEESMVALRIFFRNEWMLVCLYLLASWEYSSDDLRFWTSRIIYRPTRWIVCPECGSHLKLPAWLNKSKIYCCCVIVVNVTQIVHCLYINSDSSVKFRRTETVTKLMTALALIVRKTITEEKRKMKTDDGIKNKAEGTTQNTNKRRPK